jgi:hypothetical protein
VLNRVVTLEKIRLSEIITRFAFGEFALVSDIDGAEAGIILYGATALARYRQLSIELHDANLDGTTVEWSNLLEPLKSTHGFRVVARRDFVYMPDK